MKDNLKTGLGLVSLAALGLALFGFSGCANDFRSAGSVLTTKQDFEMGKLVPVTSFSMQDIICFHVDITWADVTQEAGQTTIEWNWYKEGKLVAHYENYRAYLKGAPSSRVKMQPASSLGVGHFKVDCLADGKVVASAEFDIRE